MKNYTDDNAKAVDRWVESGWEWGKPVDAATFARAKSGDWDVVLTPTLPVPKAWFAPHYADGRLDGAKILGLASGGGQQMPIFAAAGAECTVFDYSQAQLDNEALVAAREGYEIRIVRGDMSKPLPFEDNSFDIIFHPCSNFFVEDLHHIWRECARVLRPGGILMSGMDNCINYIFDEDNPVVSDKLPFNPLLNPAQMAKCIEGDWGIVFSHTLEEQIGGQLQAGLVLTHLFDDVGTGPLSQYYPQFFATRAILPS